MPEYGFSLTRIFSCTDRIFEPLILSIYGKIQVREHRYSSIFYAVYHHTKRLSVRNMRAYSRPSWSLAYSEPCKTSKMGFFVKIVKSANYFCEQLHLRYLAELLIRLCLLQKKRNLQLPPGIEVSFFLPPGIMILLISRSSFSLDAPRIRCWCGKQILESIN